MADARTELVVAPLEARLEWWRRAAFLLLGVIITGLGAVFAMVAGQVDTNRDDIAGIYTELAGLTKAVEANTTAQQQTTVQLAELVGQLETIKRDGQ